MLHIIALLALVSMLMLIGAAVNPDIAQFPLNSTNAKACVVIVPTNIPA
jgi:hypothetical protein